MAAVRERHFDQYLRESEGPLLSLVFVLPLAIAYEVANRGLLGSMVGAGPGEQLVAFSLLRRGFDALSATGAMLPALAMVACLLGWHVGQRRPWTIRPKYLVGMGLEASALAVPAVAAALLLARYVPLAATAPEIGPTRLATLAIGAAVYEELIFRLVGFALIHGIAVDVLGLNRRVGGIITVLLTSLVFAAYHYLGQEAFEWPYFVFRLVAGAFLGCIFIVRGFGITVGCHAAYDLLWVAAVRQQFAV
jgi:membrane protease YdiL (CAAX protease family)